MHFIDIICILPGFPPVLSTEGTFLEDIKEAFKKVFVVLIFDTTRNFIDEIQRNFVVVFR